MADKQKDKQQRLERRKFGIRKSLFGSPERPRLSVFRSDKHIYAQLIDDHAGKTLVAASSLEKDVRAKKLKKSEKAKLIGELMAERCKEKQIQTVVFDRNGFLYHGRIKAVADGAREKGLKF
jgi:large subunit ribosomal protein L18